MKPIKIKKIRIKKLHLKRPDPVPWVSRTFQEGRVWDLWMIVHFLTGAISGCVLAFAGLHPMYAYPFILLVLTAWEVGEMVFGIVEEIENWVLDIVFGMIGFWLLYANWLVGMTRMEVALIGALILAVNLAFAFFGWKSYKKRNK